ncbi:MAG: hypothetical protein EHM40_05385 [Chloroflexi bacterium]|nr:MAG: hypothetical protein EHM40_05385 [Chloroflexota bacterium]
MAGHQGFDRREILYRIGTFFLLLGIGLLVFFFLSEAAQQVTFEYFCWSLVLIVVGFVFRSQYKKAIAPSGRFNLVKRFTPKAKKENPEKKS